MRIAFDRRVWPGGILFCLLSLAVGWGFAAWWAAGFFAFVMVAHFAFFRDPERTVTQTDGVLSPADGEIIGIENVPEDRLFREDAVKISIRLTLFDVHITRSALKGVVTYQEYVSGKFENALGSGSLAENESNWIGIEDGAKRVLICQRAGLWARRIYSDIRVGQPIGSGDRIGIICYGSRVLCFVPKKNFETRIRIGQKVTAGVDVLGVWVG
ncbi:MAG: phosphatidylserine decarboxylase [Candidatus Omnitrophica bacterium]|nr:phosphatidylserine decarboxylase [Candidatus Omnitrophota bacterium]MDD5670345.1 phosphatidylserine decarboxylase [Candidatus Omnitrophota bacterium]